MVTTTLMVKMGKIIGFHTVGHAGNAVKALPDQELVCAAVSVLTQNTANALEYFLGKDRISVVIDNGDLKVILQEPLSEDNFHDAQVLLQALNLGLSNLEKNYSKYLKLRKEEVD